jgi:hypothetical protein
MQTDLRPPLNPRKQNKWIGGAVNLVVPATWLVQGKIGACFQRQHSMKILGVKYF